jgi:hypothetical protein
MVMIKVLKLEAHDFRGVRNLTVNFRCENFVFRM